MNINKFTIKSQEAIQLSQRLAQDLGQQQIENEHLFKAMLEVDENVTLYFEKAKCKCAFIYSNIKQYDQSFPKVTGGEVMLSRTANSTLNDAESIAKK
jgi:ATP-dependent Clp protease ATP-binding subunit ClpB